MSGGETDDEDKAAQGSSEATPHSDEKTIHSIPVHCLNPQVADMLHTVNTWIPFLEHEKLAKGEVLSRCGNKPLKKNTSG